jgi:hypothetical protein
VEGRIVRKTWRGPTAATKVLARKPPLGREP